MLVNKPLILNRDLAVLIGLNEAIVLQQVHYWIEKNKENKRNYHNGSYWTYNTYEEWNKEFPFWSIDTIKRTFKKLREMGLLICDRFNLYQMDRTLWYTIDYNKLNELQTNAPMDEGNSNLSIDEDSSLDEAENPPMEECNMQPAIPENSSKTSSEILNHSINPSEKNENERIDETTSILNKVIENCSLYAIEEEYRDAAEEALRILVDNSQGTIRVKIGENFIPPQIIAKNLYKLDFFVVSHAIEKFKESAKDKPIKNPISYLKACIYNGIFETKIHLDARLRHNGVID